MTPEPLVQKNAAALRIAPEFYDIEMPVIGLNKTLEGVISRNNILGVLKARTELEI